MARRTQALDCLLVIISASYKTDIPAFYGEWFRRRFRAGHCKMTNPYNGAVYDVPLAPDAVDGFVFWTKNVGPFRDGLGEVARSGAAFYVQHTINGYPKELEYSVVETDRSVQHVRELADEFGPRAVVWRYDPIIFTSLTPYDFHLRTFEDLCLRLAGATDEVVVSFAQIYKKTKRNTDWAAGRFGFTWEDPPDETKFSLATELAQVAAANSMRFSMCSQRAYLAPGVEEARCIDSERLSDVKGAPIKAKIKGNRPECECYESRDIGAYDTCPHGCVYCYAVQNRALAQKRYKAHDPDSEFLFPPPQRKNATALPVVEAAQDADSIQGTLF